MNWKIIVGICALMVAATATVDEAMAAKYQCRSSISGKMVSMKYAKAHPNTTQCAARK